MQIFLGGFSAMHIPKRQKVQISIFLKSVNEKQLNCDLLWFLQWIQIFVWMLKLNFYFCVLCYYIIWRDILHTQLQQLYEHSLCCYCAWGVTDVIKITWDSLLVYLVAPQNCILLCHVQSGKTEKIWTIKKRGEKTKQICTSEIYLNLFLMKQWIVQKPY